MEAVGIIFAILFFFFIIFVCLVLLIFGRDVPKTKPKTTVIKTTYPSTLLSSKEPVNNKKEIIISCTNCHYKTKILYSDSTKETICNKCHCKLTYIKGKILLNTGSNKINKNTVQEKSEKKKEELLDLKVKEINQIKISFKSKITFLKKERLRPKIKKAAMPGQKKLNPNKLTLNDKNYPFYLPELIIDEPGLYDGSTKDYDDLGIEVSQINDNNGEYFKCEDSGRYYYVISFKAITRAKFEYFATKYYGNNASDLDIHPLFKRIYLNNKKKKPVLNDRFILIVDTIKYEDGDLLGVVNFKTFKKNIPLPNNLSSKNYEIPAFLLPPKKAKSLNEQESFDNDINKFKDNWKTYQEILDQNKISKLYHFTDRLNMPSIKKNGGLLSWYYCNQNNIIIPKPGGSPKSWELDERKNLQNYVRVSFVNDHPMLFVANSDGRIVNPVILEIDPEIIYLKDTLYALQNAAKNGISAEPTFETFKNIKFPLIKRKYFDLTPDERPYYQAEILVLEKIPLKYILNINKF